MQDTTQTTDRLLTRSEVQDIFGVSRRYLEVAAMRGEGPVFVKIGRAVRYHRSDIEGWIDRCKIDPRTQGTTIDPRVWTQR